MRGGSVRRLRSWCVAVLVGAALVGLSILPAVAHNVLTGSSPARDAVEATVPGAVVLTFDQPVIALGTRVVVTGPTGEVQQGQPRLVDNTVTQPLHPGAAGGYTVAWRVTSVDGHPISGSYAFTAAAAGGGTPVTPGAAADPSDYRTAGVALALAAGVALLLLPLSILGWRRRHRKAETSAERGEK